jgi:hypothetical protein
MPNAQPSSPTLRFIHLSDIHFGQPGNEAINKDVQKHLIRDCAAVRNAGIVSGPATAILVAGDVAYAGAEAEYSRAGDWIDDVADAAGCNPRSVRLIPGNHDVDWKKLDDAGEAQLERLRSAPSDKCGDHLHSAFSSGNSPLLTPLEDYLSFAAAYGCGFEDSQKPYHEITYPLGDRRITIRGLSSVLASNHSDRQGAMILSSPQYTTLDGNSSELVVMVHHPLDWFKNKQEASSYFKSRSKLLLTGHEHLVEFVLKVWNGDFQQVHIAAGAVNPPFVTSIHQYAYNWIELHTHTTKGGQSLVIRIIPRVWNHSRADFDADHSRTGKRLDWTVKLPLAVQRLPKQDGDLPRSSDEETPSPLDFDDPVSQMRFTFWRHRSREERLRILNELNFLPRPYTTATFPFFLIQEAFETALREDLSKLNKALGPPSTRQFVQYRRADAADIQREVRLQSPLDAESAKVVSDNSLRAGYYRANQSITISLLEMDETSGLIELVYSADLIPNGGADASGRGPEIIAPKNAAWEDYEYRINGERVEMFAPWTIRKKTQDLLTFRYRVQSDGEIDLTDDHVWPSPVVNYVIRFRRKPGYKLKVLRAVSSGDLEPLQRTPGREFDEFFSSGVSRQAERVIWHLSRDK